MHNYDGNSAAESLHAQRVAELGDDEREMCGWCGERECEDGYPTCGHNVCVALQARREWREALGYEGPEAVEELRKVEQALGVLADCNWTRLNKLALKLDGRGHITFSSVAFRAADLQTLLEGEANR